MANQQLEKQPETITISNFTGALTRTLNGKLNSGLAKFYSSWGYNPFASPGVLTWNAAPEQIQGTIHGLALDGVILDGPNSGFLYFLTDEGYVYELDIEDLSFVEFAHITMGTPTFALGGAIRFYNNKFWITNSKGVTRLDADGTNETQIGTWDQMHYLSVYHPLAEFLGKLYVGNTTDTTGITTNIGTIDTTNTIVSYTTLSPSLPTGSVVRDMDIASDFSYLTMSASTIDTETLAAGNDFPNAVACDSFLFRWNGIDQGITSGIQLPNFGITALNNFGQTEFMFMYDSLGVAVYESGEKVTTLTKNKSPWPAASAASGNFLSWACVEVAPNLSTGGQNAVNSLYFYGNLEKGSPVGLWRMLRQPSALTNGSINQSPYMQFIKNQYVVINSDGTLTPGQANQLYSRLDFNNSTSENTLWNFIYSTTDDVDLDVLHGVYETQTQLFSKKVNISAIRVYCDPTVSGNSFTLDIIGSNNSILDNGSFTYTYGEILDPQTNSPSVERINFNPNSSTTYGIGIRITNNDDTNMVIKKIEIDWSYAGK